mgnify:FL=1
MMVQVMLRALQPSSDAPYDTQARYLAALRREVHTLTITIRPFALTFVTLREAASVPTFVILN